jgi:hypothetical protein
MKKTLLIICILAVTLSFKIDHGGQSKETGKLSVTATFRDAYRPSDEADAGCEIYAISEADLKSTKYADFTDVIETFHAYKYDYLLSVYNSMDPARNNKLRGNFDNLSDITLKFITGFRKLPAMTRAATDGTGNCTLSLKPGKYYILFVSGSAKSNNSAESKGNIGYKTVEIKPMQETIQRVHFQKQETTGIMMARNLTGC